MSRKIAVVGASGRSGAQVVRHISECSDFVLGAAVVSPKSKSLGSICLSGDQNQGMEVCFTGEIDAAVASCDAVIDFSVPDSSILVARACAKFAKPLLIATTGLSQSMCDEIRRLGAKTAILLAPNTSIGVHVLHELASMAQKLLGPSFDISIFEAHHRDKRDAPSGTALSLANLLNLDSDSAVNNVTSMRGGDLPGEHSLFFLGNGERLELVHRVRDRAVFARGALLLLERLVDKSPGFYGVSDVIHRKGLNS